MRIALVLVALFTISACAVDNPPLKSPCVGIEKSPCGPKRSINDHWMFS